MNQVFILWWEDEGGEWDFISAHSTRESADGARQEEQATDPDCEYHISALYLVESK